MLSVVSQTTVDYEIHLRKLAFDVPTKTLILSLCEVVGVLSALDPYLSPITKSPTSILSSGILFHVVNTDDYSQTRHTCCSSQLSLFQFESVTTQHLCVIEGLLCH